MAFTPGSICYLDYGEAPPCIHTRLVLAALDDPNAPGDFVVCSPDLDIFVEQLEAGNVDLTGFFPGVANGMPPPGVNPAHIYGFHTMRPADYARLLEAGRNEASRERVARGLPPVAVAVAGLPVAAPDAGTQVWILAEYVEGRKIGERLIPPAGHPKSGPWGLMDVVDKNNVSKPCLIHHILETDIPAFCEERVRLARLTETTEGDDRLAGEDVRTLEVRYGMNGERLRNFRESINEVQVCEFEDFPFEPRTALDYAKAIASIAESATAQHHLWIGASRIPEGDRSVYEDEVLARVLDLAVTYDSLNIGNLACMELVCRRRQLISDAHSSSPGAPSYTGAEHYLGQTYKHGGGIVVPALTDFVSKKMQAQSQILKERRKLAEAKITKKGNPNPKAAPKAGAASSS